MTIAAFQTDVLNPQNLVVMLAYETRKKTLKATQEDFDGWMDRLDELDGFDRESLTQAHGQLIAQGFLKFEISGGTVGLRYQISPQGKLAMTKAQMTPEEAAEDLINEAA